MSTQSLPLVSVVIPCFNAEAFIGATVESVLQQSWPRFELLVVDDCSTDASCAKVAALAQRDARVRLVRLERNHGTPAVPRNRGTQLACGEWVAYLDADDLWHPNKLELQMRVLLARGERMCSTEMKDFRDETEIRAGEPGEPRVQLVTLGMQLRKYRTPTSSIVIRRDWMLLNPFNEDPRLRAREDTDCFIRAHEDMPHSLKLLHPLVFYRLQANQISGNKLRMVGRHLAMLRRYRLRSGRSLGAMAYVYTATHFLASVWLRWIRKKL